MEPRLKHRTVLHFGCATLLFAAAGASALAQDSQNTKPQQTTATDPASKKHKVWTDDEVSTLRTPTDNYVDQKQAADTAAAAAAAAAAEQAKSKPKSENVVAAPPRLSNPKSPEDADRMIAWENRDVDAQTEYVDKLRTQLEQATPEERAQLEKKLTQRIQIVEDTKKERDALVAQKKELEKKATQGANPVASANVSTPQ
jgi:plasmid maintenance system killer protein